MVNKKSSSKKGDLGNSVWRGGRKIEIEKEDDRFTIMPTDKKQLEIVKSLGVKEVTRVTDQVFKVITTSGERDPTMSTLRSDAFKITAHHAYRPKNTEGTVYYITDKIMLGFKPGTPDEEVSKLLQKYKLRLIKEYEELTKVYLVQVTSDTGKNPIKTANELAEVKIVKFAEPNMH